MEGVERGSDVIGWWEGVSKELGNGGSGKGEWCGWMVRGSK